MEDDTITIPILQGKEIGHSKVKELSQSFRIEPRKCGSKDQGLDYTPLRKMKQRLHALLLCNTH